MPDKHQHTNGVSPMAASRLPRGLLFDLDGTLVNSGELIAAAQRTTCARVLGRIVSEADLRKAMSTPLIPHMEDMAREDFERVRRLCGDVQAPLGASCGSAQEVAGLLVRFYRTYCAEIHDAYLKPYRGVKSMLEELKKRGYPMAVVTSKLHEAAVNDLEFLGLDHYFVGLIGADDTKAHKPHPEPLWRGVNLLSDYLEEQGLEPVAPGECIYIGDAPTDLQAGYSAGMETVAVEYGFFDPALQAVHHPQYSIKKPADLLAILDG